MSRFTRFMTIVVALAVSAPLSAQVRSADASATAVVVANLSLAKSQDLSFGSHFATDGVVTSSAPGSQPAVWLGSTDAGNSVGISMALPTALARAGGGSVPFSCGTLAASLTWNGGGIGPFNPATGAISGPITSPDGSFIVSLGSDGSPTADAGNCHVDLTGARAGTYAGTATTTVTVR